MKKIMAVVVVFALAAGYISWSQGQIRGLKSEIAKQGLSMDTTTQVNDSLVVRLARSELVIDSVGAAKQAADDINAELIAAARINIQPPTARVDTIKVPVSISNDSIRIAEIHDSTDAGVLDATIVVPPFPMNLTFSYTFVPNPVRPVIGLARFEDNSAVFTVTYAGGGTVEIEAPFARLPLEEPRMSAYLSGGREIVLSSFFVRGGVQIKAFAGLFAFAEGQMVFAKSVELPNPAQLFVGLGKRFRF